MNDSRQLAEVRARIDALDDELLRLLNERAACAREVAERKRAIRAVENGRQRVIRDDYSGKIREAFSLFLKRNTLRELISE
jgi:chorismate mutase